MSDPTETSLSHIRGCEICQCDTLVPVADLGEHPLVDDLIEVGSERVSTKYPIKLLYCPRCRAVHQEYQVPKRVLFHKEYHYRASLTKDVLRGMQSLVDRCSELLGSLQDKLVLDVGCNDGSLLNFFHDKGALTAGIEPTNAAQDARSDHHIIQDYFSPEVARRAVDEFGSPDIITFTNVFAHIQNLSEVLESLRILIGDEGSKTVVIENHYLGSVIQGKQFDTFYQEHPRTYSATSFSYIAKALNMTIRAIEFPRRYGGNIRVVLSNEKGQTAQAEVEQLMQKEGEFDHQLPKMFEDLLPLREAKVSQIKALVDKHGKLRAKAFPGRAAIILEYFGLNEEHFQCVHEQNHSPKVGHYIPGTRIPIRPDKELDLSNSEPLINFAWHIHKEICDYLRGLGFEGEIIPII